MYSRIDVDKYKNGLLSIVTLRELHSAIHIKEEGETDDNFEEECDLSMIISTKLALDYLDNDNNTITYIYKKI